MFGPRVLIFSKFRLMIIRPGSWFALLARTAIRLSRLVKARLLQGPLAKSCVFITSFRSRAIVMSIPMLNLQGPSVPFPLTYLILGVRTVHSPPPLPGRRAWTCLVCRTRLRRVASVLVGIRGTRPTPCFILCNMTLRTACRCPMAPPSCPNRPVRVQLLVPCCKVPFLCIKARPRVTFVCPVVTIIPRWVTLSRCELIGRVTVPLRIAALMTNCLNLVGLTVSEAMVALTAVPSSLLMLVLLTVA